MLGHSPQMNKLVKQHGLLIALISPIDAYTEVGPPNKVHPSISWGWVREGLVESRTSR